MRLTHGAYSAAPLSAVQHKPHIQHGERNKDFIMAYIPTKPILADDPLAYFVALAVPPARTERVVQVTPALRALDQMFGFYNAV